MVPESKSGPSFLVVDPSHSVASDRSLETSQVGAEVRVRVGPPPGKERLDCESLRERSTCRDFVGECLFATRGGLCLPEDDRQVRFIEDNHAVGVAENLGTRSYSRSTD